MTHYAEEMTRLKEDLLAMASHAEDAVARAMRALIERDDALSRKVEEDDNILDQFEIEIDDLALRRPTLDEVFLHLTGESTASDSRDDGVDR